MTIARDGVGHLTVRVTEAGPVTTGTKQLTKNATLVDSLVKYGTSQVAADAADTQETRQFFEKEAESARRTANLILDLLDAEPGPVLSSRWCSACFAKTDHEKRDRRRGLSDAYLCQGCGSPTTPCAVPGCQAFAVLHASGPGIRFFCAEHRHDIPSFAKLDQQFDHIMEYQDWLKYEAVNALRLEKYLAVLPAIAATWPLATLAAPAVGGFIGAQVLGYSGAVATNAGLAWLGGGALAAGGLGISGGTNMVSAAGSALGGAGWARVISAFAREDKSFDIEEVQDGVGSPVLLADGWLSERTSGWGDWRHLVSERYPLNPVYRVRWGAMELKDVALMFAGQGATQIAKTAATMLAQSAKKGGSLGPLAAPLAAMELIKNPWWLAKRRADATGELLADLIARTRRDRFILVGHSLGARVMATAANVLASRPGEPRLEAVQLVGAACSPGPQWTRIGAAASNGIWNYYSANDPVLTLVYKTAELGADAVGACGFGIVDSNVHEIDVSAQVHQHTEYFDNISFC